MKSWLDRFRISTRVDDSRSLDASSRQDVAREELLRCFARTTAALDDALQGGPLPAQPPPGLHASIMHAVRTAAFPVPRKRSRVVWRWLPAPAMAALLLACGWWFTHRSSEPSPLAPAVTALSLGHEMASTMPVTLTAPLSDEWKRVNLDLDNSAQFLLASLP